MSFAKLISSKVFLPFGTFKLGEFFQYEGRVYIKISANDVIDLLKGEKTTYFDSDQEVEDTEIELKVL
jgi:hypothetical protein